MIRNPFLVCCGSFERTHQIASSVNPGAAVFESTVVAQYAIQEGAKHLLSGGGYGSNNTTLPPLVRELSATHPAFKGLKYESLQLPAVAGEQYEHAGGWAPQGKGTIQAIDEATRDGLHLWKDTQEIRGEVQFVKLVSYPSMVWLDVAIGKQFVVSVGDDITVSYRAKLEYAHINRIAVLEFVAGAGRTRALLWEPIWYFRSGEHKLKDVLHPIHRTIIVEKRLKKRQVHATIEWLNAADAHFAVMIVHSCTQRCLNGECTTADQYEVIDSDVGLKQDARVFNE
jgi:hypothetical protein